MRFPVRLSESDSCDKFFCRVIRTNIRYTCTAVRMFAAERLLGILKDFARAVFLAHQKTLRISLIARSVYGGYMSLRSNFVGLASTARR